MAADRKSNLRGVWSKIDGGQVVITGHTGTFRIHEVRLVELDRADAVHLIETLAEFVGSDIKRSLRAVEYARNRIRLAAAEAAAEGGADD